VSGNFTVGGNAQINGSSGITAPLVTATSTSLSAINASSGGITASSTIHVASINVNRNEYVATAGTNSGDCTSIAAPCLTINYAIRQAANSIHPGSVNIYVGDGTYTENIIAYDMMGASSTVSSALTTFPYGNSRVNLIGNPTNPSNVIIQGSTGYLGVFAMENISTNYSLDGFTLQGVNGSSESAIYATGDKANVFVNNINTTSTGRIMTLGFGATAYYDNGTGGANHVVSARGFSVRQRATLYLNKGVNVTSTVTSANVMFEVMDGGAIITGTTSQTYNFTSLNCGSGGGFFQPNGAESIIRAFSTSDVVNVRCVTGGTSVWRPISGARAQIIGNATFNVSSTATYTLADIDAISYLYSLSTPTWNVIGATPRTIRIYQGGMALDPSNFGGATVTYAEFDGDYQYGYDNRYMLQEGGEATYVSTTQLRLGGLLRLPYYSPASSTYLASNGVGTASSTTLTLTLPGSTAATTFADIPRLETAHGGDIFNVEARACIASASGYNSNTYLRLNLGDPSGNVAWRLQAQGSGASAPVTLYGSSGLVALGSNVALNGTGCLRLVSRDGRVTVWVGTLSAGVIDWTLMYRGEPTYPTSPGSSAYTKLILDMYQGSGAAGTVTSTWSNVQIRNVL
jgi:hypothetical protein